MCGYRQFLRIAAGPMLAITGALLAPRVAWGDAPALSLGQAIQLSLAAPRLRAARESIHQAQADVQTASLAPNPNLSLETGMLPLNRRYSVEQPGGPTEIAAGVSYPVDWLLFGKRAAARTSAEAGVGVAQAEYADVVRRRSIETAEAFYSVLEAEALLGVAKQTVEDLTQLEQAIEKAAASGGRPQVELSRIRLESQGARREERTARSSVFMAKAALSALVGGSGPPTLEVIGTLDGPLRVTPVSAEAAFAIAAVSRPDIAALRKRSTRARHEMRVEDRNAWPQTTVGLGVSHQFQRILGARDVTAWGAGIEVSLPLLDRNQGQRAKAASATIQADHELAAALTELRAEVEQAVLSLRTALENATEIGQSELVYASQVRDSFRKAREVGGGSLLELIDAQRSYRETYRAWVSARADYWRSLFRYENTLGRKAAL